MAAIQNDTYGELTPAELADLRLHARKCSRCGMLATVDPEFHTSRYGHPAQFTDDRGRWEWSREQHAWLVNGLPFPATVPVASTPHPRRAR